MTRRRKDWILLLSQKKLLRAIARALVQPASPQQAHRVGYIRYVHNQFRNFLIN
jgi:hypothetical protein